MASHSGKSCKKDSPAGLRRSKACPSISPSNEPTHFFKVILPSTIEQKKLKIPNKFVKKFGDELSAVSTVTTPNKCVSTLGLHKSESSIWFTDGWQEFVEHNSISSGYFLVFRYEGNSDFHVLIFDMSATEIDYPPHNGQSKHDQPNYENHSSGRTREIPTDSSTHMIKTMGRKNRDKFITVSPATRYIHKHCSRVASGDQEYRQRHGGYATRSKRRKLESQEHIHYGGGDHTSSASHSSLELTPVSKPTRLPKHERTDHEDAFLSQSTCYYVNHMKSMSSEQRKNVMNAARMYRPRNPHFVAVMKFYNVYNSYVGVPSKFASKFLRGKSEVLNLKSSGRGKWKTRFFFGGGVYKISKGWAAFARDNKVEEGDVCVFELIKVNRNNIEMKVKVFHASYFETKKIEVIT